MQQDHIPTKAIEEHDRQRRLPDETQRALLSGLSDRIREYQPCLDVGAGSGMITIPLARTGIRITALDTSTDMLKVLRSRLDNATAIPLVLGDIQEPPFGDATFGSVMAANVFHLVPDWETALTEIRRVLRADRRFLVNLGGAGSLPDDLAWAEQTFHNLLTRGRSFGEGTHESRSASDFDTLAARLGFRQTEPLDVAHSTRITPESVIQRLEGNVFARPRDIPDEAVRQAAGQARELFAREIGPLERPYERIQRIVYRCYA